MSIFAEENNMGNMDAQQAEAYFNAVVLDLGINKLKFQLTTAGSVCLGINVYIDNKDLQYPWFTKQLILHEITHYLEPQAKTHGTLFHARYALLVKRYLAGITE